ncbi:MAG: hypothetical protein ABFD18_02715 [Syntrophomonas sp.]
MKSAVDNIAEMKKLLIPVRRRIAAQHYLDYLLRGFLVSLLLSAVFLIVSFMIPWLEVAQVCLQTVAGAAVVALLWAWGRQPGLWDAACLIDSRGLKERVSTAFELSEQQSNMAIRQRQDALNQLRTYDWRIHFPWTLPKLEIRVIGAALLFIALLCVLPNPQQEEIDRQLAVKKEIKQQEKKIAEVKKELQKKEKSLPAAQRQEAVKALEELQESLQQSGSIKQALKSLGRAEEQLAALSEAELKRAETGTPKPAVSPHNVSKNSPNEGNDSSPDNNPANTGRQNNSKGDNRVLADLQQAAQSIADARMALLAAANNTRGQLAAANGNGSTPNAGSAQGTNGTDNSTGAVGMNGNLPEALGASGGTGANTPSGQQGQGGSGPGNSGGGNQAGNGTQPGSGSGSGSGAGLGSGNGDNSSGQMTAEAGNLPGTGFPDMKSREYEKIYDPQRLGINGESSVVRGKAGNGPQQNIETADPALMPGSLRPYQEVIGSYSQAARESLGRSAIPAGMSEVVKNYFSSLEE